MERLRFLQTLLTFIAIGVLASGKDQNITGVQAATLETETQSSHLTQDSIDLTQIESLHNVYLPLIIKGGWNKGAGVDLAAGADSLTDLDVDWWYNWGHTTGWEDPRFVPMVRPGANLTTVADLAAAHPGKYWLIFNEPDINDQDNITPTEGALFWQRVWKAIKGADPTAKLLCCGTAFANTAWLESWRTQADLANYPVDGIHFHGYPCSDPISQNCMGPPNYKAFYERFRIADIAIPNIEAFFAYLQTETEFQGKPVWITELGILSNTTYDTREAVRDNVMCPLLDYLNEDGGKEFAWVAWFSTFYPQFDASNLVDADDTPTELGISWNKGDCK